MNVIFLSLSKLIRDINSHGIYPDLLRKFVDEGHNVYIVCPYERREHKVTELLENGNVHILCVRTLNILKSNSIEKGIATLLVEKQYSKAIGKYFSGVNFELILYSTPPVSFNRLVESLKRKNPKAKSYLLLKDIFPQNAIDLGMFKKGSLMHKMFEKKEKKLYEISDYIGCMSPANMNYLLRNNPSVRKENVEIAPNSMEYSDCTMTQEERNRIRIKYGLPIDKPIIVYGGNLGKPQGIDYVIKCLDANKNRADCHFLIIGGGTEFYKLESWKQRSNVDNVSLVSFVPKSEYDMINKVCDIGLIFLDHRFTIPNYPSRLLGYLECKMPIIAATDRNSDVGSIAEANGYGFWCESINPVDFIVCINKMLNSDYKAMGNKGYKFLMNNYQVKHTYQAIVSHFK